MPRKVRVFWWSVVALLALQACGGSSGTSAPTSAAPPATVSTTGPSVASTASPTATPPATSPGPATTVPGTAPGPMGTAPGSTPPEAPAEMSEAAALDAFEVWVAAIAAADTATAWDLMAETSRLSLGSFEIFASWESALVEGWGAWDQAEDVSLAFEEDEAGRTMARIRGTVTREGMTEDSEAVVFVVLGETGVVVSPFEEFGNVARGLIADDETVPVPPGSGTGRRIVYANAAQRVWVVETDGTVVDTYLVSGREGVPAAGEYEVFSKSEVAYAGHDGITMRFMVRFARSPSSGLAIGFHSIPNRADGTPLQTEEQLGEYHSAGCVRQSFGHAAALYDWADEGTQVIVIP